MIERLMSKLAANTPGQTVGAVFAGTAIATEGGGEKARGGRGTAVKAATTATATAGRTTTQPTAAAAAAGAGAAVFSIPSSARKLKGTRDTIEVREMRDIGEQKETRGDSKPGAANDRSFNLSGMERREDLEGASSLTGGASMNSMMEELSWKTSLSVPGKNNRNADGRVDRRVDRDGVGHNAVRGTGRDGRDGREGLGDMDGKDGREGMDGGKERGSSACYEDQSTLEYSESASDNGVDSSDSSDGRDRHDATRWRAPVPLPLTCSANANKNFAHRSGNGDILDEGKGAQMDSYGTCDIYADDFEGYSSDEPEPDSPPPPLYQPHLYNPASHNSPPRQSPSHQPPNRPSHADPGPNRSADAPYPPSRSSAERQHSLAGTDRETSRLSMGSKSSSRNGIAYSSSSTSSSPSACAPSPSSSTPNSARQARQETQDRQEGQERQERISKSAPESSRARPSDPSSDPSLNRPIGNAPEALPMKPRNNTATSVTGGSSSVGSASSSSAGIGTARRSVGSAGGGGVGGRGVVSAPATHTVHTAHTVHTSQVDITDQRALLECRAVERR